MTTHRNGLGISASEAARQAGVHRLTWRKWERDEAVPEDYNHVRIETTLKWRAGSVTAALAGQPVVPDTGPELRDEAEREIWGLKHIPAAVKLTYIEQHRARMEQAAKRRGVTLSGKEL